MAHKSIALLTSVVVSLQFCAGQDYNIRPLSIRECNHYDAIFIGTIKLVEKSGRWTFLIFEVDEEFKYRERSCHLIVRMLNREHYNKYISKGGRWLVFAEKYSGMYYFNPQTSMDLHQLEDRKKDVLIQNLHYLRNFPRGMTGYVCEISSVSWMGCIPNDDEYISTGLLVDGVPHGRWEYVNLTGNYLDGYECYQFGNKWGHWDSFWETGFCSERRVFFNDVMVKLIRYDNQGELYCVNSDCILWEAEQTALTLPVHQEQEKNSFCSPEY